MCWNFLETQADTVEDNDDPLKLLQLDLNELKLLNQNWLMIAQMLILLLTLTKFFL